MNEEDMRVVETMELYGGSFVKALAALCWRADQFNLERIKGTWPEYWSEYKKLTNEKNV